MNTQLLFTICLLHLFDNISTNISNRSENICDTLFNEDFSSADNQQWKELCKEWNISKDDTQSENLINCKQ